LSSDHIRAQLARSLSSLREQEAALASSLASELAASNTSREASASAAGTTSAILKGDLDEVRSKVERVQKKVKEVESGEVGKAREGVRACLLSVLLPNLPFLTYVDSVTELAVVVC
jgi:altered-inheritance-of-mitochondria protein 13